MDLSIRSSISVTDRAAATKSPGYSFRTASGGCSRERSPLGYQDSNLEWLNQNQLCCQLHHTPMTWAFGSSLAAAAPSFRPRKRVPNCSGETTNRLVSTRLLGSSGWVSAGRSARRPGLPPIPASAVRAGNPWRMRRCRSARDPNPFACGLRFARHRHPGLGARSRSNSGTGPRPPIPRPTLHPATAWWLRCRGGAARQCHRQRGSGAGPVEHRAARPSPRSPAGDRWAAPLGPARRSRGPPGGVIRWARPIRVRPAGGAWILPARAVPWIRTAAG